MSFEDKCIGQVIEEYPDMDINNDEETDSEEADVLIETKGSIPMVKFLDKVHNEMNASLNQTVVIRLLVRGMGYKGL